MSNNQLNQYIESINSMLQKEINSGHFGRGFLPLTIWASPVDPLLHVESTALDAQQEYHHMEQLK